MKKLLILLLVITLTTAGLYFMPTILSLLPTFSTNGAKSSEYDFRYTTLDDGTVKVISYSGEERIFELPEKLAGRTISTLGDLAFYYMVPVQEVTIPDTIVTLEANPFLRCDALEKIIVSETHPTLAVIDGILVDKTSNTVISYPRASGTPTIPAGVSAIGDYAYASCDTLTTITIPTGVTSIGNDVFYYCSSLTDIAIPEGVTTIGDEVFMACTSLRDITLPESLTSIGSKAFYRCKSLTSLVIPDSVTSIGRDAFLACYALTLTVGENSYAEQYAIENNIPYIYANN